MWCRDVGIFNGSGAGELSAVNQQMVLTGASAAAERIKEQQLAADLEIGSARSGRPWQRGESVHALRLAP